MNIKAEITKIHYDKNAKGFIFGILRFASLFYGMGSGFKNLLYDKNILKPNKVKAYVISVGNLTTGGVGKTPVVAEIASYLINKGNKVAIVSRGYGGKLSNKKINVISDGENIFCNAKLSGDEPFWLASNTKAVVITSKNRYKAAEFAVKEFGVNYIILDDGFQHRKLHRDLDVVLFDSEKVFGNGYQLPAGPLRECKKSLKRADRIVVVSKNINHEAAEKLVLQTENELGIKTLICKTEPDYIYNIFNNEKLADGAEIIAMTAIGQPEQFFAFLNNFKIKEKIVFDDHYSYSLSDVPNTDIPIVTTEKDAVKLKDFPVNNIFALKLKTVLDIENFDFS